MLVTAAVALVAPPARAARQSSTCIEDDAVPTPAGYAGWERSSVTAWEAVEQQGGIVPDIEEDRAHFPPKWLRYPSPMRSAELLADEARKPNGGLYTAVPAGDLQTGDILVRTKGAGACGKMAIVAGRSDEQWVILETEADAKAGGGPGGASFFDGPKLRPEVLAYRVAVKRDSSMGHVRGITRDLDHLERTIAERPPLVEPAQRGAVDDLVHQLIDEAASLAADPDVQIQDERRVLTGRALAIAAALDWPGAGEQSAAVLDDVLKRTPSRPDAALSRARVLLLAGENDKALSLAEAATAIPGVSPRVSYVVGRALLAAGKPQPGLAAIKRYLEDDPFDPRAKKLVATGGKEPAMLPPPRAPTAGELTFTGTAERGGMRSASYGFSIEWPQAWRVVARQAEPATGVIVELTTGRANRDDGETERAGVSLIVHKPEDKEAAALARKGARNMFPEAKLKSLPPLLPGSKREQFREKKGKSQRQGEVTTLERNGAIYFLVLNASPASYPKLKDEYATFVKSLSTSK
jgi:hypothetical protein